MQNTKIMMVVADTLGNALVQLDAILQTQFKDLDCQIQNIFCVPEARPTRIHGQMQVVCNLVCVMVSDNPETVWPMSEAEKSQAQLNAPMKAIKE